MRTILFLHRYMAAAVGVLMTLWCLSGFVMMYQEYPSFTEEERLRTLQPLNLSECCALEVLPRDDAAVAGFRMEMLAGAPVLRSGGRFGPPGAGPRGGPAALPIDLRTGQSVAELSNDEILGIAKRYGERAGIGGQPRSMGVVAIDQWTIQSARRNQPAHHIAFDDPAGTEIYINGASGEIFQDTDRGERMLAWLGAIPHWLYPTALRQNGPLWTQVVIWTSVVGTFLAATGLYVGVSRLRRSRDGKLRSPYRGWWYWHHMLGLFFGVLTLTWVFSGLMTMNPWGLLEGRGRGEYREQLTGTANWSEVREFIANVSNSNELPEFVQLRLVMFNQKFFMMAARPDGTTELLDKSGARARIERADVESAIGRLGTPVKSFELMQEEDSFYYGHKRAAELPVYRTILDDAEQTRIYINPSNGAFRTVDANGRWGRWIRNGLHGIDFAGIRKRPVWDIVVLLLLAGVTAVCVTGTWMALKRVRADYRKLQARLARGGSGTAIEES